MKIKTDIRAGEGLGDAVANITHLIGVDRLANAYEKYTGNDCGCDARQEKLNQLSISGWSNGSG
ncbi:MAG: hypothetical protein R3335_10870 [Anaerolineales bacterium]|nr:hypothetical protein [Anaerolineales bacterium]